MLDTQPMLSSERHTKDYRIFNPVAYRLTVKIAEKRGQGQQLKL